MISHENKPIVLKEMPSAFSMYRKLLFTSKKKLSEKTFVPEISYLIEGLKVDYKHLQSYKNLCFFNSPEVPVTYPYSLAGPLHLALILDKRFPVKAAGLLHTRNHIVANSIIDTKAEFALKVSTGEQRFRPQGFEFDVITSIIQNNSEVWSCTSTLLKRGKFEREDKAAELEDIFEKLQVGNPDISFSVPRNIGKQYAKNCKDYNPIHVSLLLAKLFGYRRTIAHGMWVSAAALGKMNRDEINTYDLAFKGPVFTGSTAGIKIKDDKTFNIFTSGNERPVILGIINR